MKIDQRTNNILLLQSKHSDSSSLEENSHKFKVDDAIQLLGDQLKDLNLKETDSKLIERGPITTKDSKAIPINKPYQKVTENVHVRHTSGGTTFCVTHFSQHNCNSNNTNPSVYKHIETSQPQCNNCCDWFKCDHCILKVANSPEFKEHLLQYHIQETHFNIPSSDNTLPIIAEDDNPNIIKPSERRISHDSGFQSDNPSPRSDGVLSPRVQPNNIEPVTSNYRRILPKTEDMQKNIDSDVSNTKKVQKQSNVGKQSSKEVLRATLNPDVKQVKWVDLAVMKDIDELFETDNNGKTFLHKLLENDDKYKAESLYAAVEKMKMNPDRCSGIIDAKSSICDVLTQNKHPKLWLDYFCEALQIIKDKIQNNKSRNKV